MGCTSLAPRARIVRPFSDHPRVWFETLEPRRVFSAPAGGFGVDGVAQVHFDAAFAQARDVAVAPDGRIVVLGYVDGEWPADRIGSAPQWRALARFDADGSPDRTFGPSGDGAVLFSGSIDGVEHLLVQPDGRILLTGIEDEDSEVVRFNVDGSLDTTFNSGEPTPSRYEAYSEGAWPGNAAWLDAEGRTTIMGLEGLDDPVTLFWRGGGFSVEHHVYGRLVSVRINADGTPDQSYGPGGVATAAPDETFRSYHLQFLAAQPINNGAGVIAYLGGYHENPDPEVDESSLLLRVQLDAAGRLVSVSSIFPLVLGPDIYGPDDVTLAPDGSAYVASRTDPRIQRFDPSGAADESFGVHGVVTLPLTFVWSTAVAPDGKLLVEGAIEYEANGSSFEQDVLLRLNPDGSLDTTFHADPRLEGFGMILRPLADGSTLLGGGEGWRDWNDTFSVRKLLHDGAIAPSAHADTPAAPTDEGAAAGGDDPGVVSDDIAAVPPFNPGAGSPFAVEAGGLFLDPAGAIVFDPAGTRQPFDDNEENPFG